MEPTQLDTQAVVTIPVNHWLFGGATSHLCCPVCGSNYVHIARVAVDQGHVRVEASEDQVHVCGTQRAGHRGSAATLAFWCEEGHWFEYEFRFHKGNTFIDLRTAKLESLENLPQLWRN